MILALHLGHNTTVSLYDNKKGVFKEVVSQEKFDNVKNSPIFPKDVIDYILNKYNLEAKDLEKVLIATSMIFDVNESYNTTQAIERKLNLYHKYRFYFPNDLLTKTLIKYKDKFLSKKGFVKLVQKLKKFEIEENQIYMIEHHNCHIYAPISVLGDNNEKYLIFSMDGGGDGLSSTVSIYENKQVKTIAKTTTSSSIGLIYGGVTELLGMRSLEHEYKVMGLAAYAKKDYFMKTYNKVFRDLVTLNDDLTFTCKYDTNFIQFYLKEKLCVERFDNVAGALQYFTEDLVIKWIKLAIEKTGIKNVMLSGGVFMNVKLNQKIIELKEIDKVFTMPSSGDESNVFGATAYFVKNELKRDLKQQLPIYLGMEYSNNEIEKFIKENQIDSKYKVEYVENIEKKVAQLLADFKVVARFKGRTEFGARSLGNRAILANPSDMKSFYMVNDQIKVRDFWMPFAPSILDSYAEKYLKNYTDKYIPYYMVATYNSSDKFQNECRAAMHQGDKTARPQIVTKSMNEDYYNLIAEFEKLTGIGAVMNTSFNLHGYPLVGTPEQAIFTMDNSDLEYLAIENWLISKR